MPIEQLRYTWARDGLLGKGMLQPMAASPALTDRTTRTYALATRLCRYDRIPGDRSYPVSYGWLDSGAHRFAFNRRYLPDDQNGRTGNFAAHVLVAPRAELPSWELLRLWDSDLWWAGPEQDTTVGVLPHLLLPSPIAAEAAPDREATIDLLARVLRADGPVRLDAGNQDALIGSVRGVVAVYPTLIEQRSFSTFESGTPAGWFDIVGTLDPSGRPRPPDPDAIAAARYTLSSKSAAARLRRTLGPDTRDRASRVAAIGICSVLLRQQGREQGDHRELARALRSSPDVVLSDEAAVREVAGEIVRGNRRMVDLIVNCGTRISDTAWRTLGSAVAATTGFDIAEAHLAQVIDDFSPRAASAVVSGWLATGALIDYSTIPLVYLAGAARSAWPVKAAEAEALHRAVLDRAPQQWVSDTEIDPVLRADLLANQIVTGRLNRDTDLARHSDVLGSLAGAHPQEFLLLTASWNPRRTALILIEGLVRGYPPLADVLDHVVNNLVKLYLDTATCTVPPELERLLSTDGRTDFTIGLAQTLANPHLMPILSRTRGLQQTALRLVLDRAVTGTPEETFDSEIAHVVLSSRILKSEEVLTTLSHAVERAAANGRMQAAAGGADYVLSRVRSGANTAHLPHIGAALLTALGRDELVRRVNAFDFDKATRRALTRGGRLTV